MLSYYVGPRYEECRRVTLSSSVVEIELVLDQPRVITIFGIGKKGCRREWHLKVTNKGNLVLV